MNSGFCEGGSEAGQNQSMESEQTRLGERTHREDLLRVHFHQSGELLSGEPTVEVDDGSDGNELDLLVLFQAVERKR